MRAAVLSAKELGGVFPPHGSTERIEFEKWWARHALTLNQRASLVWDELAWAGWFARAEIAEGKLEPTIFPRREGE